MPHLLTLTENTRGPMSPRRKQAQNKRPSDIFFFSPSGLKVGGQPIPPQTEKGPGDVLPGDRFAVCLSPL